MIQKLYTIHDRVANVYEPPVASQNDGTVMRWFTQCVNTINTMKNSPADFALYEVGSVDTDTGIIDARSTLLFVCTALDCINNIQEGNADETTKVGDETPVQSGSEG